MAKPAAAPAPAQKTGAPLAAVKPGATPPTEAPQKPKSRWAVRIAVLVLVLGGAGGAAWYFLGHDAADAKSSAAAQPRAPTFLNLEPFTVNLAEESGDHYLQAGVVLQVRDDKTVENLKAYMPVVRNRMLLLLSAKHPSDLATAEGKKKLIEEIVQSAREALPPTSPDRGVLSALFSAFVIQ